jgi:tRNA(fMet)-specific endonuclease VapC
MYILDTNILRLLDHDNADSVVLQLRLGGVARQEIFTTIINYEEQVRGWLALAAQTKDNTRLVTIYMLLRHHLETFRAIQLLDFDIDAAQEFENLQNRQELRKITTPDKKIAAIALAHNAVLITQNLRDFVDIPNLKVEDWTRPA